MGTTLQDFRSAPELQDAWHKFDRAKKHIADTKAALERTPRGQIYAESTDADFESVTESRYLQPVWNDDLTEANCAAGDAIHNLRSALDSLAFALSEQYAPTLSEAERRRAAFPIKSSQKAFADAESEITRRLGPGVYSALSDLKPYPEGNIFLWGISQFDNIDKHRSLLRLGHVVKVVRHRPGLSASPLNSAAINAGPDISREPWQPFGEEIRVATKPLAEGWVAPTMNKARSFDITFGGIDALTNYPVVELLNAFSNLTESILGRLEREFFT